MRSSARGSPRFEDVTETVGIPVTDEAAEMLYTRYRVGAGLSTGKRVLELGCAAGHGLGLLAQSAAHVVGADFSCALLDLARRHFRGRVPLTRLTAEALPFRDATFDLVLFLEASYYVPRMNEAFREIARVLAPGGQVLFVNANPERTDFITSPYSVHYHTADEFREVLEALGMAVNVEGAFPVASAAGSGAGLADLLVSMGRRMLESLSLVPKTLRGRARLKRLLMRRLSPLPPELREGFSTLEPRVPVGPGPVAGFKVIYVRGTKRSS